MQFRLIITPAFLKNEKQFLKRHPDIKERYKTILLLLQKNPNHPSLRLHKIHGFGRDDLYSISINLQYRLVVIFVIKENKIIPVQVGTHDEVYNR